MAEPAFVHPSPFDRIPPIDPSSPLFFDSDFTLDDLVLPTNFAADFTFDDFDISTDLAIEDFLQSPQDQPFPPSGVGSPAPNSNDGSGVSSSYTPSGHQSSDLSRNNGSSFPDSGHSAACSPDSRNCSGVTSQEVKLKEENSGWSLKRKGREDGSTNPNNPNPNPRSSKYRRSEGSCASPLNAGCEEEEEEEEKKKRKARLRRNRESAQLSRQRKKHYVEELEEKVKLMHSTINDLNTVEANNSI